MAEAGILVLGFVLGGLPFSNLVAKRTRGVDLRDVGVGKVSTSALYRLAGTGPLLVAALADIAKGTVAPLLAGDRWVLAAFAGGVTVIGHNWSPFLRGAGGRGVAPALGALAVNGWPGSLFLLGGLGAGKAFRTGCAGRRVHGCPAARQARRRQRSADDAGVASVRRTVAVRPGRRATGPTVTARGEL